VSNLGVDHSRVHGNQRQIISFVCHRRTPHFEEEWTLEWWHPYFLFPWVAQLPRQLFQVAMRNAVRSIYGIIFGLEGNRTG